LDERRARYAYDIRFVIPSEARDLQLELFAAILVVISSLTASAATP
jgi:hypothetical protein